jgi:hypothetical protein
VRIVDHENGSVPMRKRRELGQRRERAVHAEHAIGRDPSCSRRALGAAQPALQTIEIGVIVEVQVRATQSRPVDEARVVEPIAVDHVIGFAERGEHT